MPVDVKTKNIFLLTCPLLIAVMELLLTRIDLGFKKVLKLKLQSIILFRNRGCFFSSKLGMVDFFTDEINTYLVGNNESIACTGTHQTLHTNVKDR